MALSPRRPCEYPGCVRLAERGTGRCKGHPFVADTKHEPVHRGSAASRLYGYKWRVARLEYLEANPFCVYCLRFEKRYIAANVVDHIVPHHGDLSLFWDRDNWQSLCLKHHNRKSAREKAVRDRRRG